MNIEEQVALGPRTTIRVGGTAEYLCEVTTIPELVTALRFARERALPIFVLGGGSNLILHDEAHPGLMLVVANDTIEWHEDSLQATVGAGVSMDRLVRETTERGLAGLENAGGLPGSVGGAIRGNAGCFGWETKDTIVSVTTIDPETRTMKTWTNPECQFRYRTSIFKETNQIIWEAVYQFTRGDAAELTRVRDEKITYRKTHHPQAPSVGSMFQNLKVDELPADFFERFPALRDKVKGGKLPAGALFEALNLKGYRRGGAMISHEHANIPINVGQASGQDVRDLVAYMKQKAHEVYDLELHEEPQFVERPL